MLFFTIDTLPCQQPRQILHLGSLTSLHMQMQMTSHLQAHRDLWQPEELNLSSIWLGNHQRQSEVGKTSLDNGSQGDHPDLFSPHSPVSSRVKMTLTDY